MVTFVSRISPEYFSESESLLGLGKKPLARTGGNSVHCTHKARVSACFDQLEWTAYPHDS